MREFIPQFRLHPVRGKGRSHLRSSTGTRPSIDILLARQRTPGAQGGMMSRDLPARPKLEHLRKQAKDRLRDLRLQNADAKLADAQHAVARDYGFTKKDRIEGRVTYEVSLDGRMLTLVAHEQIAVFDCR